MAEPGVFTPYSTISSYFGVLPSWVAPEDQERIAAYQTYEEIYWNHPETFKLVLRGTENKPIYVPSGRIIVETANRFVGKGLRWVADPLLGTPGDQAAIMAAFNSLFRRETFGSKYNSNKRYGIMRGDWVFHITADDTKLAGSRISIHAVDPGSYFKLMETEVWPNDPRSSSTRVAKVHLVDQFVNAAGKDLIRRQTYEKLEPGGTQIQTSTSVFEPDKWFKAEEKGLIAELPPKLLPPEITSIPVYLIKNFDEPGNPFGSSEMRGLERLMAGINQAVSDTDMALALEGLGLYTTESEGPVDDDGNEVDWIIGPGRVVENVRDFKRVNGVSSVKPSQDHVMLLDRFMKEASGTPDAAVGMIDVQIAESGVALALKMAPIISKAEEKDQIILDVLAQMSYDLSTMWFPSYEGTRFGDAQLIPVLNPSDKLPKNRKAVLDEVINMMMTDPPILSSSTAREILQREIGVAFSSDELTRIVQERALSADPLTGSSADSDGDRMDSELSGDGDADTA